jgi:hypothetical protein
LQDRGIAQGSVLGPLVCNVILSNCLTNFFDDPFFNKSIMTVNMKGNRRCVDFNRFLVCYADDVSFRVASYGEAEYCISKISSLISVFGLKLNFEKTSIYDLSSAKQTKFDYLGYTFMVTTSDNFYSGGLVNSAQKVIRSRKHLNKRVLLNYITNSNFKELKTRLKATIFELKNKDLDTVIKKVNAIIKGVSGYYNFADNSNRLDFLYHFVDRCF